MKGQMFILTAAIVVVLLVTLKGFTNLQQITSEKDILDVNLENLVFDNIRKEVEEVIKFSVLDPSHIADNSVDFLNFTKSATQRQGLNLQGIFVGAMANSTNQTMNITVFNFRGDSQINFTVKLNTSSPQTNSTILNDYNVWYSNFTFVKGDGYNLTISLPDKGYEKNITVQTKENSDVYVGFYDLGLISERATHKRVFQETVKIKK